ncbi:hypothetical protein [Delftia acidovorans]|uniref:hypothetical protein n=1 Tax=Delftia acidovorans TaxID=80866 RepID=UPI002FDD24D5
MQDKHTPAPWVGPQTRDPKNIPLKAIYCERLGFCLSFINTDSKRREEEAKANAHLIATAPDLLSAMKSRVKNAEERAFEDWMERERPSGDVESVQRQWEESSDLADMQAEWFYEIELIARATGSAQ